ncbi:hypothetical protein DCS_06731 [Drechmeria coniospora]|uniref:Uncharacterized protein n=1 Tax=Drechmeria coniospora TaxID=98403 RepID=A0A151GCI3_DRECN|nr:hypothetical protein DCS_06731 [Drechmeria coniospora]KYK54771.1 hypothetical protein DCS_06731 [Drechmeria coniospora]
MATDCTLKGNADLYGFGVRLGVYGQWIATLLTTVFDPVNEAPFRLLNLIIQASIFVGLCNESRMRPRADLTASGEANAVGAVVVQFLLCGSLSSVTGDGISHFDHISGILRLVLHLALSAYGVWFWFRGVDVMTVPACVDGEVAFFGPSSLTGWFRWLGKTLSVGGVVACVGLAAFSVHRLIRRFGSGIRAGFRRPTGRRPQVEVSLLLLSMGLIALSISTVEYLIATNDIQGVGKSDIGSVAQLIPLLAGAVACFLSLWKLLARGLLWRKRCWLLLGRHL